MKLRSIAAHALTFVLVVTLAWTLTATAQAEDASDQSGAEALESLQPIVITAERRSVDLQQAALEVIAIGGAQIQQQQLTEVSNLTTAAAGFQSSSQGGFFVANNIRGMGSATTSTTVQLGVPIIIDGILNGTDIGHDQPMFDVADTEVLQGPQGTFIGASAIAGAVEVSSVNPNFNGLNGFIMAGIGDYTDQKLQGGINLQLSDTFAMRLAFNLEQRNSYFNDVGATSNFYYYNSYSATNPASDGPKQYLPGQGGATFIPSAEDVGAQDNHQLRLKGLWKPTDNYSVLADVEYTYNNHNGIPVEPNPYTYTQLWGAGRGPTYSGCTTQAAGIQFPGSTGTQLLCPGAGAVSHSTYYYPGEEPYQLDYYAPGGVNQDWDIIYDYSLDQRITFANGIVARWLAGNMDVTTERESESSDGPEDAGWLIQPNGPGDHEPQTEIDIISPTTGKVNWITGASFSFRQMNGGDLTLSNTSPFQPNQLYSTLSDITFCIFNRNEGLFGQMNWQITHTLQLGIGARENWDDNSGARCGYQIAPVPGTTVPQPEGTGLYKINYTGSVPTSYTVLEQLFNFNKFQDHVPTGKINLNWTPLPGQNFYVFYARGYSSGGVNTASNDFPTFKPQYANDWEAGWKGSLLDNHLRTQVSTWYEIWQNFQNTLFDPVEDNDTAEGTAIENFPSSTIYGADIAAQSRFGGFGANIDFNYLHTALGAVSTLNTSAEPAGWASPYPLPQCLPGHNYSAPTDCFNYLPYYQNLGGEPLLYAPRVTANVSMDYIFQLGRLGTVDPRLALSHTDKQFASIFEIPYNELDTRNVWNANVNWTVGKYSLLLFVNNFTDRVYFVALGYYGTPRTMGAQLTYKF